MDTESDTIYYTHDINNSSWIVFPWEYNSKINRYDLIGYRGVEFGYCFNQSLEDVDLEDVRYLTLGWSYNQSLNNVDLSLLRSLTIGPHVCIDDISTPATIRIQNSPW